MRKLRHSNQPIDNCESIKIAMLITFVACCYFKFVLVDEPARDTEVLKLTLSVKL
jgi:hypothetical protein